MNTYSDISISKYETKKKRSRVVRAMARLKSSEVEPGEILAAALTGILARSYYHCDDRSMSLSLELLGRCRGSAKEVLPGLLSAVMFRPVDSNLHDPKSWREDVLAAIVNLLKIKQLQLNLDESKIDVPLTELLSDLFRNPIDLVSPVLMNAIEQGLYVEKFTTLLLQSVRLVESVFEPTEEIEFWLESLSKDIDDLRSHFNKDDDFDSALDGLERLTEEIRNVAGHHLM